MTPLPRWTIILRRGLLSLAAACTLIAAGVVEENIRGDRDWKAFRRQRAESGLPLDYAFYSPTPVPDDQNLILAPTLARFFNPEDGTGAAWKVFAARIRLPWMTPQQTEPDPSPAQIQQCWQQGQRVPLGRVAGEARPEAAREFLAALAPIKGDLDALDAAAQWRPRAQIPFQADGSIVPGSFTALRSLTRLLVWRAAAELELKQVDAAFADTYAALRLAEACIHYPTLIHAMFGTVMVSQDTQAVWEGWVQGAWTSQELERLQTAVTPFHTYLEFGRFFASTAAASAAADEAEWPGPPWMPQGWRKQAAIEILNRGSARELQRLDVGHTPLTAEHLARLFVMLPGERAEFPVRYLPATNTSLPLTYPRVFKNMAAAQTALQLATVAGGVQRFQRDTGRYPTDLAALVPKYLFEVPFDYMDGNRLRYHPTTSGGFVLYSIGPNGRDDDGALPSDDHKGWPWTRDNADGDWSWPTEVVVAAPAHS